MLRAARLPRSTSRRTAREAVERAGAQRPTTSCSWTARCRRWTATRPRGEIRAAEANGAAHADRRHDRERHERRSRALPGRRHGRLPDQAARRARLRGQSQALGTGIQRHGPRARSRPCGVRAPARRSRSVGAAAPAARALQHPDPSASGGVAACGGRWRCRAGLQPGPYPQGERPDAGGAAAGRALPEPRGGGPGGVAGECPGRCWRRSKRRSERRGTRWRPSSRRRDSVPPGCVRFGSPNSADLARPWSSRTSPSPSRRTCSLRDAGSWWTCTPPACPFPRSCRPGASTN